MARIAPSRLPTLTQHLFESGTPQRQAGLREFHLLGGRGLISFLGVPRHECVYVCNVTWYG